MDISLLKAREQRNALLQLKEQDLTFFWPKEETKTLEEYDVAHNKFHRIFSYFDF